MAGSLLGRVRNLLRPRIVVSRPQAATVEGESLSGRTILLSGASGGIGAAIAALVAAQGARVLGIGRRGAALQALVAELGAAFVPVELDLVAPTLEQELARVPLQEVDALIHCAGVQHVAPIDETTVEAFDQTLQVNLRAAWLLTRAVLPGMKERRRGDIIHIASVMSRTAAAGQTAYCASKWGLDGMVAALRHDVSPFRIRASVVYPGRVNTPIRGRTDEIDELALQPQEVARLIGFILTMPGHVALPEVHVISVDEFTGFQVPP